MFIVDTNILLYAANQDFDEHEKAKALIENWRINREGWYVTYGIIYEFLRVVTHPRVFPMPWDTAQAWEYIEILLGYPGVRVLSETAEHLKTASELMGTISYLQGNLVFDFHTAVIMKEHGVKRIYTRDSDFHKFDFLEVIDPFQN